MIWKIRHQGSPRSIDGLTFAQVVQGLQDGLWEPTDEVMGPEDRAWVAIENHPQLAELVLDLEPPPSPPHDDETRIDMNPLIDVALVLLIFFILTTSYAQLQRLLQMPSFTTRTAEGKLVYTDVKVKELLIKVEAKLENGKPVIYVEDKPVDERNLVAALRQFVKDTRKTEILITVDPGVSWGTTVAIQDAAKGAGIQRGYRSVPSKK